MNNNNTSTVVDTSQPETLKAKRTATPHLGVLTCYTVHGNGYARLPWTQVGLTWLASPSYSKQTWDDNRIDYDLIYVGQDISLLPEDMEETMRAVKRFIRPEVLAKMEDEGKFDLEALMGSVADLLITPDDPGEGEEREGTLEEVHPLGTLIDPEMIYMTALRNLGASRSAYTKPMKGGVV